MELKNLEEVVALAGLLHDIGKLYNRTKKDSSGTHPMASKDFVAALEEYEIIKKNKLSNVLKDLVQRHHEYSKMPEELQVKGLKDELLSLGYIVSRSDTYSSYERDDEKDNNNYFKTRRLDSIFHEISMKSSKKSDEKEYIYRLNPFHPREIFPVEYDVRKRNKAEEVDNHVEKLGCELQKLKSENFNEFFTKLYYLLEKYLWCIPSDTTTKISDISLFDHLKSTSALALASYKYHVEKNSIDEKSVKSTKVDKIKKFLLISGDISGIQNYIYGIDTTDKISKRLRSRSFFISILSDIVVHKYLNKIGLTIANNVISAGGKFYIIADNTEKTRKIVEEVRLEIEDWLYTEFHGEIYLNTANIEMSGENFREFANYYDKINDKINENKNKKYELHLKGKNVISENYDGGILCKVCGKFWSKDLEEHVCIKCKNDEKIGTWLPTTEYLAFYRENQLEKDKKISNKRVISFFKKDKTYVVFYKNKNELFSENINPYLVLNLKESELLENYASGFKYYAGYIPTIKTKEEYDRLTIATEIDEEFRENIPKTFEQISIESEGVKNLAVLKADVDNLSAIFSIGLDKKSIDNPDDNKNNLSISRIATLSRMLDAFFSGWIPLEFKNSKIPEEKNGKIVEKPDMTNNYIIYSGGDDLMILGPWDKIIETSKYIYDKFKEFTCNNDEITLSAGVAIIKPSEPVSNAARKANRLEEMAKNNSKDSLAVFNHPMKWDKYDEMSDNLKLLNRDMESRNGQDDALFSQSFIYRLLNYTNMAIDYANDNRQVEKLMYYSKYRYDVTRNILPKLKKIVKKEDFDFSNMSFEDIMDELSMGEFHEIFSYGNPETGDPLIDSFKISLNIAVRKNRK
ncbi:MAG: type III-A CRISPR-associated protein Cas10/Csm1 [Fusobacteria bacterium]|nr:type III-A CRISPR-associated protein Cas10/Csm1 [Fusobacteriota bacterium]